MTDTSANLALPFIQPAQAQKHVTHNEAIEKLDVLVQLVLQETSATVPPAAPTEGEVYALGDAPDGLWAGHGGELAAFQNGGWVFIPPSNGWLASQTDGTVLVFANGQWQATCGSTQNIESLGINTTADTTNRLAVSGDATLLTHAGGGHQVKVNKQSQGETASVLFQSGWSGRAEMGLAGNDNFSIKVSADGSTWTPAITVNAGTGTTTLHKAATFAPGAAPSAVAGSVYFDQSTAKLRCFDGTVWHDLF